MKISNYEIKLVSANDIQKMDIPKINWIVEGLLPEGLALLAGRPKVGKSWLSSQLALSVASGSKTMDYFQSLKSKVVYIALEDNLRRLKDRINLLMQGNEAPADLYFLDKSEFNRFYQEGLLLIKQAIAQYEDLNLIIIDTLGNAISRDDRKFGISFQQEYDFMSELQNLALQNQLCILLIHHTRKTVADSVYDEIVGTTGITAAPDTLLILKKQGDAFLMHVTGRDIKEESYLLSQDEDSHNWIIVEKNVQFATTIERQDLVDVFNGDIQIELQVKDIAEKLDKHRPTVSQL